jgi:hypothetical protein
MFGGLHEENVLATCKLNIISAFDNPEEGQGRKFV